MNKEREKYSVLFTAFAVGILLCFSLLFFMFACKETSSSTPSVTSKSEVEIKQAWEVFLTALEERQPEKLKKLSLPYLLCTECMYRSENYQKREILKAYKEDQYVEADFFYSHEFQKEFPHEFVGYLRELEPKFENPAPEQFDNIRSLFKKELKSTDEVWIVNLQTTPPGKLGIHHEGGSHLFPFLKTKDGYKFGGLTTVP